MTLLTTVLPATTPPIGVGLRQAHYAEILASSVAIDFVEVHSENFFGEGGAARALLRDVADRYPVSLHGTALGLGSARAIPDAYMASLRALVETIDPFLVSDHAAFAWSQWQGQQIHAGDLLPVAFNQKSIDILSANIDRVQQLLGRSILLENLSAYVVPAGSTCSEMEFLSTISQRTGCQLLIDLNNLIVNGTNQGEEDLLHYGREWLDAISEDSVGEIHLAGFSPQAPGEWVVDDHSQPVSETTWSLYACALQRFGAVPTLIEWDNDIPTWSVLVGEAEKARHMAGEVLADEQ